MKRITSALTVLSLASLVSSCGGGGGSSANETGTRAKEAAVVTAYSAVSDANGVATALIPIPEGANKLAVVSSTDAFIGTDLVANELGIVYAAYDGEAITASTDLDTFVSAVSAPSRDFDPPLSGTSLTVQTTVASSYEGGPLPGRTVNYSLLAKSDSDLTSGTLQVNISYIGVTAGDPNLRAAMQQATEVFRQIYGGAGITLSVNEFDFAGPDILPDPSTGDAFYGAMSNAVPSPSVNICLGLDLTTPDLLGLSAGIPGSPLPSVKSCVGVSVLNAAGPDGEFSAEDNRVLGETLAHEVGHFMGLFHPVESDYGTFDPLIDTPACAGEANCDAALGTNNMYYTPIADGAGGLIPQTVLTPQQRGVMNLYAAVD